MAYFATFLNHFYYLGMRANILVGLVTSFLDAAPILPSHSNKKFIHYVEYVERKGQNIIRFTS